MMNDTLPRGVVREDAKLERASSEASAMLAELRWHWTLDETNDKRVSLKAYAREVGKPYSLVHRYANGYALTLTDHHIEIAEAIARAAMSAEREAATEAVAKERGVAFGTARQSRPTEVRRVLNIARERAEETGNPVAEEARKAAKLIVRDEQARGHAEQARRDRGGLRYIELEERMQRVRRELVASIGIASHLEIGSEEQELLEDTLGNVKALLELLDLAITGSTDVDWDAELVQLGGNP